MARRTAHNPAHDLLGEAVSRVRDGEDQFLLGNPRRSIEVLGNAVEFCEAHRLERSHACLKAHIDLYRIHKAMGHRREASRHFEVAVSLGANPSLLQLN